MKEDEPKSYKNAGVDRLLKALACSWDGLSSTFKHEAAFRSEVIAALVLIPVSLFMRISLVEHLILIGSVLLVLIVELINSAIESVVDDISLERRPLAKRAKDTGSAAVFISLLNAAICWLWIIVDHIEHLF